MTDVIVVLPGIGGSVLRDARGAVFDPSARTLWRAARHRADLLETLAGDDTLDDPEAPQPVWADRLIGLPVAVPGLATVTSYQTLRRRLAATFDLTIGDPTGGGPPANYFEFAYDWRRDNRVSAHLLKRLIDRELPRWSGTLPDGTAKVILIGHSMGGLVAKYYLGALHGWQRSRALITYGTPFRGSVKALDLLANGVRKGGVEVTALSQLFRRFSSVYQLLPRFPVVMDHRTATATRPVRVTDLGVDVGGLDAGRARAARSDFHRPLDPEHSTHAGMPLERLVDLVPVLGYGHPTLQSAVLDHRGRLTCATSPARQDETNPWFLSGDGTVPVLSALPIELSESGTGSLENETHGVIHGRERPMTSLVHTLARYGARLGDQQFPGGTGGPATAFEPALGLTIDEVFEPDEPVVLACSVPPELRDAPANVVLDGAAAATSVERDDEQVRWTAEGLAPGSYTVTVTVGEHHASAAFEVG